MLLALSVWVAANGAVFRQDDQGICQANNYALESLCWYTPEFSPLVLPFIHHRVLDLRERLTLAYFAAVGLCLAIPTARRLFERGPNTESSTVADPLTTSHGTGVTRGATTEPPTPVSPA